MTVTVLTVYVKFIGYTHRLHATDNGILHTVHRLLEFSGLSRKTASKLTSFLVYSYTLIKLATCIYVHVHVFQLKNAWWYYP